MPALELFVSAPDVRNLPRNGNLPIDPPLAGLDRVLLRRLTYWLRVPPHPGAYDAVIDTGAPLTVIPREIWDHQFHWQAGRDYDDLSVPDIGTTFRGQVLGHHYSFRLARLRVAVELAGRDPKGDRLRLDSLVCQLADAGGPRYVILGLWGGPLVGRRLSVEPQPDDDLAARLEF